MLFHLIGLDFEFLHKCLLCICRPGHIEWFFIGSFQHLLNHKLNLRGFMSFICFILFCWSQCGNTELTSTLLLWHRGGPGRRKWRRSRRRRRRRRCSAAERTLQIIQQKQSTSCLAEAHVEYEVLSWCHRRINSLSVRFIIKLLQNDICFSPAPAYTNQIQPVVIINFVSGPLILWRVTSIMW